MIEDAQDFLAEACRENEWDVDVYRDRVKCTAPNGESININGSTMYEDGDWNADLDEARDLDFRHTDDKISIMVYGTQGYAAMEVSSQDPEEDTREVGIDDKADLALVKERITNRAEGCGFDVGRVGIVGSYARGEAEPGRSDLDVVIEVNKKDYSERSRECLTGVKDGEIPSWMSVRDAQMVTDRPHPILRGTGIDVGWVEFHMKERHEDLFYDKHIEL